MNRLIDRFEVELRERGLAMPGELNLVGVFGDLTWPPCDDVISRSIEDPAFTITGKTRYVAIAWIIDEIRFFAARIEPLTPDWWFTGPPRGEHLDRIAAIEAESEERVLAIFPSIADAVTFTCRYLVGASLHDLAGLRIVPTRERYE